MWRKAEKASGYGAVTAGLQQNLLVSLMLQLLQLLQHKSI
jgi:hypothetical protein